MSFSCPACFLAVDISENSTNSQQLLTTTLRLEASTALRSLLRKPPTVPLHSASPSLSSTATRSQSPSRDSSPLPQPTSHSHPAGSSLPYLR
ncbi:hypothetical protein PCANC_03935 [Puccinia coronata f. sp. avenae]|uniref:Uncharacterized protein n=1 Tax=Puccinia coronata f. sp. avenae TaxID=200324 RepID=A0A2N5W1C3_9BASI|nr:hypothetical protein PCANC_03935 [Puccinia coronata f. sp. avenae]